MGEKRKVPVIDGLLTWPSDDPRLIVGRCTRCGAMSFPKAPFCQNPDCEKRRENVETVPLSKRGILYTYSVQIYPPPLPFRFEPFRPYGIGMVDFPEGIRILGMITESEGLAIGVPVETVVGKLYEDEENEYLTWMWKPLRSPAR